jgi:hypothetical protein
MFRDGSIVRHVNIAVLVVCSYLNADGEDKRSNLSFTVLDQATNQPVACRVHLKDSRRRAVKIIEELPFWNDHFVCAGTARISLASGEYTYEIERGPEYNMARGTVVVRADGPAAVAESLTRIANLPSEGWWSGETHIHRPLEDIELLMRAEDLYVGVATTWWNKSNAWTSRALPSVTQIRFEPNRVYDVLGGEDERGGGALLFSGLKAPLPIAESGREFPSSVRWLHVAKDAGGWVDAEKPFWWDFPLWLATGRVDSIGVANNHANRETMLDNEAWGKPRNRIRYPGPHGNALWTHDIFFHTLNAGLRIPPSAGSASGVLPNPVGYNRMYVYLEDGFSWDHWWNAVRQGRVFVTNGPLLRLTADGHVCGHVFQMNEPREIEISGKLDSRDAIKSMEIVRNGIAEPISIPAKIKLDHSGWFLVRVIADVQHTCRFAMTAPWYVELNSKPARANPESCQFFMEWIDERLRQIESADMPDSERADVLRHIHEARQFWSGLRGDR